ncbi:MAG: hypothetical protein IAF58_05155 [Leptolyngbya sp.]|nr:hypothetical protein [Candidatus Melainabacteria bacterium]
MQQVEAQFESPKAEAATKDSSSRLMDEVIQSAALTTDKNQSNGQVTKFSMQDIFDRMLQIEIYPGSNPFRLMSGYGEKTSTVAQPVTETNKTQSPIAETWKLDPFSDILTDIGQMRNASSFVKNNMNKLDTSKDGAISKSELETALKSETNERAKVQIENILNNYKTLKDADSFDLSDGITARDGVRSRVSAELKEDTRLLGTTLLEGKTPLFLALDIASNGDVDGVISQMDLVNFLTKCQRLEKEGRNNDGIHLPENAKLVTKMLQDWSKSDSPTGQLVERSAFDILTSNLGTITVESMAKGLHEKPLTTKGGYSQLKELNNRMSWGDDKM